MGVCCSSGDIDEPPVVHERAAVELLTVISDVAAPNDRHARSLGRGWFTSSGAKRKMMKSQKSFLRAPQLFSPKSSSSSSSAKGDAHAARVKAKAKSSGVRSLYQFYLMGNMESMEDTVDGIHSTLTDHVQKDGADCVFRMFNLAVAHFLSTMPFKDTLGKIKRILTAFAVRNFAVKMGEGMELVCWFLLGFMSEEQAFWTLCTIVEDIRLRDFYASSPTPLNGFHVDTAVLSYLAANTFPDIANKVGKERFRSIITLIANKWLLSLFVSCAPLQALLVVFTLFLNGSETGGDVALFRLCLAVIAQCEFLISIGEDPFAALSQAAESLDAETLLAGMEEDRVQVHPRLVAHLRTVARQHIASLFNHSRGVVRHLSRQTQFTKQELLKFQEQFKILCYGDKKEDNDDDNPDDNDANAGTSPTTKAAGEKDAEEYDDLTSPRKLASSTSGAVGGGTDRKLTQGGLVRSSSGLDALDLGLHKMDADAAKSQEGITRAQFAEVLRQSGSRLDAETIDRMFDIADASGNGAVDFRELVVCLSVLLHGSLQDRLRIVFELYDADHSGYLERSEVEAMAKSLANMTSPPSAVDAAADVAGADSQMSSSASGQIAQTNYGATASSGPADASARSTESKTARRHKPIGGMGSPTKANSPATPSTPQNKRRSTSWQTLYSKLRLMDSNGDGKLSMSELLVGVSSEPSLLACFTLPSNVLSDVRRVRSMSHEFDAPYTTNGSTAPSTEKTPLLPS